MADQATTQVREAVEAKLTELGDTADAVADRLRALGIKGQRDNITCCAIANVIKTVVGDDLVEVDGSMAFVPVLGKDVDEDGDLIDSDYISLPEPVKLFVNLFDAGVYLDLVEVAA